MRVQGEGRGKMVNGFTPPGEGACLPVPSKQPLNLLQGSHRLLTLFSSRCFTLTLNTQNIHLLQAAVGVMDEHPSSSHQQAHPRPLPS